MPREYLSQLAPTPTDEDWDLAAESIAVKIRWFGLIVGAVLANFGSPTADPRPLNLILLLGLGFTLLDTFFFTRRRVVLRDHPLVISVLESFFIGLLCYFQGGLESPFRYYYLLSLVCCAIRFSPRTTFITCGLDCLSYLVLYAMQPAADREPQLVLPLMVLLVWIAWATSALAKLLKRAGEQLRLLNGELRENKNQLETRIAERTRELEETQAQVLHQEKMAAFGLLAAGIAHEVGNPLTSISSLVQVLEQRDLDEYTRNKLGQVGGQLARIQTILRELVNFSRPASTQRVNASIRDIVDEALGIAKFYKGGKNRVLAAEVPDGLPLVPGVHDQLVQIVFNLVLNAIDATGKGGRITVSARTEGLTVVLRVADDGAGIAADVRPKLFRPYFTTKKHGTGLGLFVIRKIVEEHGGRVTFEDRSGQGATFLVELPTVQPVAVRPAEVA
ncbi:sensor histidine kinase [Limnoglobus roseus]|uniref:histidine kinase n=1 Tax=Limnoglobus roseus TaxID=2598579 RepID=A0A5C1ACL4_9BACT|nr:ATP-binding protein [Limnoglobus roseus]QEL16490.1 GHKL domain-containing protein [Limnoglobus roseus]